MSSTDQSQRPDAMETLEQLSKLANARITATSPQKRARVTLVNGMHSVDLRPEGFQKLDPGVLADEVVHAFTGAMRGYRQAEDRILDEYPAAPSQQPEARQATERDAIRRAYADVEVSVSSPAKLVHGTWNGSTGVRLRIEAVNESHRVQLAEEISTVLNTLSERFRTESRKAMSEVHQRLREESP